MLNRINLARKGNKVTLKNKIVIIVLLFLVLISTCLLFTKWAADQIYSASKTSKAASEIQSCFLEIRICFTQTLMGPHDYLIHGDKNEKNIFKKDFKRLNTKKNALKQLLLKNKANHAPDMTRKLEQAQNRFSTIENGLPRLEKIALSIFEIRHPVGNSLAGPYM